jgi:hypothetical protein
MRPAKYVELISGLLAPVLGLVGLGILFLAPLSMQCSSGGGPETCQSTSYLQANGWQGVIMPAIIIGLPFIGLASGTVLDLHRHSFWTSALLLLSTAVLGLLAILSSARYVLLPCLVCAFIAVFCSFTSNEPIHAQP